ncbi:hypothetical protein [Rhodococcus rhodochrous]|uniref:hypothetical protein n=1 Tax=Rhodococcus rhodochrous TaxID=1829 RepID=UPI001364DEE5|nr:hypothetical protein [Rhodococcus rhodochrous]
MLEQQRRVLLDQVRGQVPRGLALRARPRPGRVVGAGREDLGTVLPVNESDPDRH